MRSYVISCNPSHAPRLLADTEVFECVRGNKQTLDANVSTRAHAVLEGAIDTLNTSDLPSWGAVGCALSHVALWERLVSSGEPYMAIFEDDAVIKRDVDVQALAQHAVHLGCDVLLLGWRLPIDTWFRPRLRSVDEEFKELVAPRFYETHAYIITNKGARALLAEVRPIEMQIDAYMGMQRARLGMRFLVPARGPIARQRRAIWNSGIQTSVMRQCAPCRLPPPMRSGWAALVLLLVLATLVGVSAVACARAARRV